MNNKNNKSTKQSGKAYKYCIKCEYKNHSFESFQDVLDNNPDVRYCIVAYECTLSTKYKHFQIYLQLKKQTRGNSLKKLFNDKELHWEVQSRYSTNKQARDYCWKGQFEKKGTKFPQPSAVFLTWGLFCEGQGKRTEMVEICSLLDNGYEHKDVYKTNGVYNDYIKSYGRYMAFFKQHKCWEDDDKHNIIRPPIKTKVIIGDAGTGKTQGIYNKHGAKNIYKLLNPNGDNKNWNGYTNQKILLIDDFYSWIKLTDMMMILDNKPYRCRKLGSYVWAQWETVYITSNQHPDLWYPNETQKISMIKNIEAFRSRLGRKCLKVIRGNTGNLITKLLTLSNIDRHNQKEYLNLDDIKW